MKLKYRVEGLMKGRWIRIGQGYTNREKAARLADHALESGLWEDARVIEDVDKENSRAS